MVLRLLITALLAPLPARAVEPNCIPPVVDAVIEAVLPRDPLRQNRAIDSSRATWVRYLREHPNTEIPPRMVPRGSDRIALLEAYIEVSGGKQRLNLENIRKNGTPAQKLELSELMHELTLTSSPWRTRAIMMRLFRLQAGESGAAAWLKRWILLPGPTRLTRQRQEALMAEDFGNFLFDKGLTTGRSPTERAAAVRELVYNALTALLVFKTTGLTPLQAPIVSRLRFLPFFRNSPRAVAVTDAALNAALRAYMVWIWYQNFELITDKGTQFALGLGWTLLTTSEKEWRELETANFKDGDRLREVQDNLIAGAMDAYIYGILAPRNKWQGPLPGKSLAQCLEHQSDETKAAVAEHLRGEQRPLKFDSKAPEDLAAIKGLQDFVISLVEKDLWEGSEIPGVPLRVGIELQTPEVAQDLRAYMARQPSIYRNLRIENVAGFLKPEDITVLKNFTIHQADFRWQKASEYFVEREQIKQLRDAWVLAQKPRDRYEAARLELGFSEWPIDDLINEVPGVLKETDREQIRAWQTHWQKIPKPK